MIFENCGDAFLEDKSSATFFSRVTAAGRCLISLHFGMWRWEASIENFLSQCGHGTLASARVGTQRPLASRSRLFRVWVGGRTSSARTTAPGGAVEWNGGGWWYR